MNNGDPTFMSFATGTQSAFNLTIVTPDLHTEMEWYTFKEAYQAVTITPQYSNISKLGKIPK
jgi:hypothetical protein